MQVATRGVTTMKLTFCTYASRRVWLGTRLDRNRVVTSPIANQWLVTCRKGSVIVYIRSSG